MTLNDDADITKNPTEDERILLEHGYIPSELSKEEKADLLLDLKDIDDASNDGLSEVVSPDEK